MGLLSKASIRRSAAGQPDNRQDSQAIKTVLDRFYRDNASFQGIFLALPGDGRSDFNKKVSAMVSSFGYAAALPSGRSLVLFSKFQDRELLAHRLAASLHTSVIATLAADNPDDALESLHPSI
jgi:hypothetical protein